MSRMLDEAREAPAAVARQLGEDRDRWHAFGARLRAEPPTSLLTIARGSSDHAAHYAAYLIMARLGRLVTSMPMSLVTLYHSEIRSEGLASFAFSQSGQSPDLVGPTEYFRRHGAVTCAFVNDPDSPLARAAEWMFCLHAGQETSVAATKSFIATLAALLRLTAEWAENDALAAAIARLPQRLQAAADLDWSASFGAFAPAPSLMVIGRGSTLAIAREAALKLKETCNIHAEGYSGAEFQHGPMALVAANYPILMFMPADAAKDALVALAADLRRKHAALFSVEPGAGEGRLPALPPDQPETDAVCQIQSFYAAAVRLAKLRGVDADRPRHLNKVTRTR